MNISNLGEALVVIASCVAGAGIKTLITNKVAQAEKTIKGFINNSKSLADDAKTKLFGEVEDYLQTKIKI